MLASTGALALQSTRTFDANHLEILAYGPHIHAWPGGGLPAASSTGRLKRAFLRCPSAAASKRAHHRHLPADS